MKPLLFALLFPLAAGCAAADMGGADDGAGRATDDLTSPSRLCRSPAECAAAEQRAFDRLAAVKTDPGAVAKFMRRMPKGGDLHHHLSGSVYAETYLSWAAADGGFCIASNLGLSTTCPVGATAIPTAADPLHAQLVASWSMEGFVPTPTLSGHDHFFSTFGKFGPISGEKHHGKGLADVMKRADDENESYIELMLHSNSTARTAGGNAWSATHGSATMTASDFAAFRAELLATPTWPVSVQAILNDVSRAEAEARDRLACSGDPMPSACSVMTRYEVYISRSGDAPAVFAQMVAAFEAAKRDNKVVALNLVGPEDGLAALKAYDIQMAMLDYLHTAYAKESPLRISLHAGELAKKYMPEGYDLSRIDHIRNAVRLGHANRIGHGVDVMFESDPQGLLAELKAKNVLVEVCLTSNIQILEVSGVEHPLASYLAAGVPVALATDDQGVSRSSIANEFSRAVLDQNLDYRQLKTLARNSLEHSFIPGESLWSQIASLTPVGACASASASAPTTECSAFLATSERATAQWDLEKRFGVFESAQ